MALTQSEKIDLVRLAMKRVNVVSYGANQIQYGTNPEIVELSEDPATVCQTLINVTRENYTCHLGFSAVLSEAADSVFYVEVDGNDRSKRYANTNATLQFLDMFQLSTGLHSIVVKATAESAVEIAPREAQLGVYL